MSIRIGDRKDLRPEAYSEIAQRLNSTGRRDASVPCSSDAPIPDVFDQTLVAVGGSGAPGCGGSTATRAANGLPFLLFGVAIRIELSSA